MREVWNLEKQFIPIFLNRCQSGCCTGDVVFESFNYLIEFSGIHRLPASMSRRAQLFSARIQRLQLRLNGAPRLICIK
jgi:hypothetical protein